jgi:hypothetical protein
VHLADAANVMTPAYLVIRAKGYDVNMDGDLMVASKGHDRFVADGPVALLGLIVVGEMRGDDWRATDREIADFMALYGG